MTPLLASGVELMLLGMGTVFVFLTVLVIATVAMSKVIAWIAPPDDPNGATIDATHIAVITAAIAQHRKKY